MPTYTYRCEAGHEVQVTHAMSAPALERCAAFVEVADFDPHAFDPFRCGKPCRRIITAMPQVLTGGRFDRASGYQPHLARFPNDPEAFTSGPQSLQRLIDARLLAENPKLREEPALDRDGNRATPWKDLGRIGDMKLDGAREGWRNAPSAIERAIKKVQDGKAEVDNDG